MPGGGQQFAFHETQPSARRMRPIHGGGGSMAIDPRARARALAGAAAMGSVPGGVGIGSGRKVVRSGTGSPGPITAEDMERIVTGN